MTLDELLRGFWERIFARAKFYGFYLYEVVEDTGGAAPEQTGTNGAGPVDPSKERMRLRRVDDAAGLPDALPFEKLYGAHGLYERASVGLQVLVGFVGGNRDRPFVGFYLPSNPDTLLADANGYVQIGTTDPDRPAKRVFVGSKNRLPVARKTDPVACGLITFTPGPNLVTISYAAQGAPPDVIGTLAVVAGALVFTPGPGTPGIIGIQGQVMAGSGFFSAE